MKGTGAPVGMTSGRKKTTQEKTTPERTGLKTGHYKGRDKSEGKVRAVVVVGAIATKARQHPHP
jgi:uncharacterized protein YwbE